MKPKKRRKPISDQKGLEAFAINLKEVRAKYAYSQVQLAYEADLSLSQIARIETAKINPGLSAIFAIARAMNVPLSELFDFKL
ncbi:transcriptional regulator [Sphingobacteriaceae bacterium]|nr:transcriptional regulator [Sphingobacteriaceae bacterium]